MSRLFALKDLIKAGRLALRLLKDARVPLYAKAVPGLAVLYVLLPLDLVPDWLPVIGQMDDLAILLTGISFFIRLCPPELVQEHERGLGYRGPETIEGRARPIPPNA